MVTHLLIIHKLSVLVDLVFHREVDGGPVHMLTIKHLHFRLIFFILEIPDHIREPHRQAIVTAREKAGGLRSPRAYFFSSRIYIDDLM